MVRPTRAPALRLSTRGRRPAMRCARAALLMFPMTRPRPALLSRNPKRKEEEMKKSRRRETVRVERVGQPLAGR
eukprot:scaffold313805_cov36-Tisochrysis_lutea.AAC.1